MAEFSVTGSMDAIERDLGVNIPHIRKASLESAAGRMCDMIKTQVVRHVASNAKVKQKLIRGRIAVNKMKHSQDGRAVIKFRLPAIPLEAVGSMRETRAGVRSGSHSVAGAFVGKINVGRNHDSQTAFKRVGRSRLPIHREGVELIGYAGSLEDIGDRVLREEFPKRFTHEMRRRLGIKTPVAGEV